MNRVRYLLVLWLLGLVLPDRIAELLQLSDDLCDALLLALEGLGVGAQQLGHGGQLVAQGGHAAGHGGGGGAWGRGAALRGLATAGGRGV